VEVIAANLLRSSTRAKTISRDAQGVVDFSAVCALSHLPENIVNTFV
jgi:hypothetical protein